MDLSTDDDGFEESGDTVMVEGSVLSHAAGYSIVLASWFENIAIVYFVT